MENASKSRKTFTIGFGGPILSGVIVAARAAVGTTPMEEWSVLSWFLMTLPITLPAILVGAFLLFCAIVYVALKAYQAAASLFSGRKWK